MKEKATAVLNLIGGLSGIVSILTIVFLGGSLVEKVRAIDGRLSRIEATATSEASRHIAQDDERDVQMSKRVAHLETITDELRKMAIDIRSIEGKLDVLKEKLTMKGIQ